MSTYHALLYVKGKEAICAHFLSSESQEDSDRTGAPVISYMLDSYEAMLCLHGALLSTGRLHTDASHTSYCLYYNAAQHLWHAAHCHVTSVLLSVSL